MSEKLSETARRVEAAFRKSAREAVSESLAKGHPVVGVVDGKWRESRFTDAECDTLLEVVRNADLHAVLIQLNAELEAYEQKHGMPTVEMRGRVVDGTLPETRERLAWLMLHNRKRDVELQIQEKP